MVSKLNTDKKIVGTKEVKRALMSGEVKTVYIAKDADKRVTNEITMACDEKQIPVVYVETMKKLGETCKIDVSAASAALLK
ncbi:ribosomal L7Ae/L30e/S12e/Gadd45 family protein [Schnuerera sp.]|uniref:ribosomal L7Ae/L30e/S12e/Gadd45 family protein n=1 Tax=Schnuerera sp. TaxID=2794844 RepID=UPI002BCF2C24|nr:ribosomal L7Ae/L30e/S12e/Gadd45 family protein [Schnuerera sp.]HSH35394.1 ribosomal L7Ae/L30e/S12e/Gadd45 family protein [Schnuerera sp.]